MNVVVKQWGNDSLLPIQLDNPDATIRDLKDVISSRISIQSEAQRIVFPSTEVEDTKLIRELNISDGKHLFLLLRDLATSKFQIHFYDGSPRVNLRAVPWIKFVDLQKMVADTMGSPQNHLRFHWRSRDEIDFEKFSDKRISNVFGIAKKYRLYATVRQPNFILTPEDASTGSMEDNEEVEGLLLGLFDD